MVATDAHRLVRYTNTGVNAGAVANFILPKKPASLLKNLLAKEENDVKVTFGAKNARFEFGNTIVVCRQIEGRFPNYNAVIPQANQNIVTVDRQTMINACKRVAVFANNGTAQLRLALSENQIRSLHRILISRPVPRRPSRASTQACLWRLVSRLPS